MQVKTKEQFTLIVNREELNAILLGLSQIQSLERYGEDIKFYGYGVRNTKKTIAQRLIKQIERL